MKVGDHVAWQRPFVHWHHAIVSEINAENNEIVVVNWNKDKDGQIRIIQERQSVTDNNSLFNQMYRVEYPEEILNSNEPELVLARARSRIGDTGYGIFSDNCESFATYCKTGYSQSHQVLWLENKIIDLFFTP